MDKSENDTEHTRTGQVKTLACVTTLDIPADRVLHAAIGKLSGTVVVGWDEAGELYLATSLGKEAETLWLLEHAKKYLLALNDE